MELQFDHGTILAKIKSENRNNVRLQSVFREMPWWRWDPRVNTYRAPAHRFYELLKVIKSFNLSISEAITVKHTPTSYITDLPQLRPYQIEAFSSWFEKGKRGIVVLPTGAGKTRLAIYALQALRAKTLVLVPTRVLLHQWHEIISQSLKAKIGRFGDGHKQLEDVTVATYESAIRAIPNIGDHFEMVVVDEVHHFLNGERIEIVEMLCAPICLGLSATFSYDPARHARIKAVLGPIAFQLSLEDLKGIALAPFQKFLLPVQLSTSERALYENLIQKFHERLAIIKLQSPDLNSTEVFQVLGRSSQGKRALAALRAARQVLASCENKLRSLSELLLRFAHRKILIFTADSNTTIKISSELLIFPILAETSKTERKVGINYFLEGRIGALVTCRVLNEGFDVPSADLAIIVGGSHGEREHIQRIGRVLRAAPGKTALIYELVCRDTIEMRQWRKRNNSQQSSQFQE